MKALQALALQAGQLGKAGPGWVGLATGRSIRSLGGAVGQGASSGETRKRRGKLYNKKRSAGLQANGAYDWRGRHQQRDFSISRPPTLLSQRRAVLCWSAMSDEAPESDAEKLARKLAALQERLKLEPHQPTTHVQQFELYRKLTSRQTPASPWEQRPELRELGRPRKGSGRLAWFRYKARCDQAGIKFTHRELAAELGLSAGTVRNLYSTWAKRQKGMTQNDTK
jgi:hypothetical protein